MSRKTAANSPADGVVQLAILCIYMRRIINYDWLTVNISVLIQPRNISFQNYISLKTMKLGVLSWEKLKNCETHDRIESSPGRVKKRKKFINFCLKVGHSANLKQQIPHEDNLSSRERYKIITSKALGTVHAQHFLTAERERSIYEKVVVLTSEVFVRSD